MSDLPELSAGYGPADLEDAVVRLREVREGYNCLDSEYRRQLGAFEESLIGLMAEMQIASRLHKQAEEQVREVAMAVWMAGDKASKTLRPGIGIRETNEVTYDDAQALAWAKHAGYCLQLDQRAFEKLVIANVPGAMPPGLATVKKVPTVTIGKDLP